MNLNEQPDYQGWQAHVAWSTALDPEGLWYMYITDKHGEQSDLVPTWRTSPTPPPLVERYDALAALGYAVVEGGGEAWEWRERTGEDGREYFVGTTGIRPMTARERETAGAPPAG